MSDNGLLGVQLDLRHSSSELGPLAERLADSVDVVWMLDQPLARETFVSLAAVALGGRIGIGTSVTHPIGRDPITLARGMGSVAELVPEDKEVLLGVGSGGPLPQSLYQSERKLARVKETMTLIRELWSGRPVELDDYPVLGSAYRYLPGAKARLAYPVTRSIPIIVAGTGPRIQRFAGEMSDGVIHGSIFPKQSLAAFRTGNYAEISGLNEVNLGRESSTRDSFRMIYQINVSISRDRQRARDLARSQMALIVANKGHWPHFEAMGFDLDSPRKVQAALVSGGIEEAKKHVADVFIDEFMISGTPEECIPKIDELKRHAASHGFADFYLGVPVGPDLHEVGDILLHEVGPELWPERQGRSRISTH